ncbi:MAG TPA: hypothetical protein VGB34_05890 [Candidatus Limnocylindria bacterium]|jgi:hypothetical protein
MRPPLRPAIALALTLALVACTPSSISPSATETPGLALSDVEVEPMERPEAGIALAFDATTAAELVVAVPDSIDFASKALVCVYLGERPTAGWRLDLDSATLSGDELRIEARENTPRSEGGELHPTFPADCALVNRAALPAGQLSVSTHDTLSDEAIVVSTVVVPDPAGAP